MIKQLKLATDINLEKGGYFGATATLKDADPIYQLIANTVKNESGVFRLNATSRYKGRNGSTKIITSDLGGLLNEIKRVLDVFNRVPKEATDKKVEITFFFDDPEPVIAFRPFFQFEFEITEGLGNE